MSENTAVSENTSVPKNASVFENHSVSELLVKYVKEKSTVHPKPTSLNEGITLDIYHFNPQLDIFNPKLSEVVQRLGYLSFN